MKALALALCFTASCSSAVTYRDPDPPKSCSACAEDAGLSMPKYEAFQSDGLLGSRWAEVVASGETHATFTKGEPHIRSGGGLEFAWAPPRNGRVRLTAYEGLTGGAWGDEQHGGLIWESAAGLKISIPKDSTMFDFYGIAREGLLVAGFGLPAGRSIELGNVLGGGVGLRVFRSFSVEVTGDWVHAFDSPFTASNGSTTREVPQLGLALRFDFCSLGQSCTRSPVKQTTKNATCAIYDDANAICRNTTDRARLCKDARDAMSFADGAEPVLARDSFSGFLTSLASKEKGDFDKLATTNDCLAGWRSCGRRGECLMSQHADTPTSRRMYSPYVLEVLTALGCDALGNVVDCGKYKCEDTDPEPKPRECRR